VRKGIALIVYIFLSFVMLEAILRLQQKLGPLYDLGFNQIDVNSLSDIVNHKNPPIRYGKEILTKI